MSLYFIWHRWGLSAKKYRGFHLRRELHIRVGPVLLVLRYKAGP